MESEADKFQLILRERAKRLSQPLQEEPEEINRLIVFSLGGEFYGFEVECAREVVKVERITFVPCAPDFVEGVIDLRGRIISVVDLAKILDLQSTARSCERWTIVVEVGAIETALHIDSVQGVIDVLKSSIEPPVATLERKQQKHFKGQARIGDCLVRILDLESTLVVK